MTAKPIGRVLLEIFGIIFGVILGFILNEWRVAAKQAKIVETSITAMKTELSDNYDRVASAREYHLDLYPDILIILRDDPSKIEEFQRTKFRGIRPAQI